MGSNNQNKPNLATEWKNRIAEMALAREGEKELTAEIELMGFNFIGRRLPLQEWIRGGRLPSGLLRQILKRRTSDNPSEPVDLSPDELVASLTFQRDAITYAIVEPRIVVHDRELADDEIRYSDLCQNSPDLVDAILQWIFANSPGIPVATTKGGVNLETVEQFHQKQPGGVSPWAGTSGSDV